MIVLYYHLHDQRTDGALGGNAEKDDPVRVLSYMHSLFTAFIMPLASYVYRTAVDVVCDAPWTCSVDAAKFRIFVT